MALLRDFEKIECPVHLYSPEKTKKTGKVSSRNSNFALQLETGNDVQRRSSDSLVPRLKQETNNKS